jgi:two-component sensor histidine kinase
MSSKHRGPTSLQSERAIGGPKSFPFASRDMMDHSFEEDRLRKIIAQAEAMLVEKDEIIREQKVLSEESDHRLLNGLQLIMSLLSLQSRATQNAEAAAELTIAANRIATIGRIHRRLHSIEGIKTVAFKHYLDDLCEDLAMMLSADQTIVVKGDAMNLPAVTAVPLGFVVNELITNAAKHGTGQIKVTLTENAGGSHALSVFNDGPALPAGFDPTASKGLGMKIIRSLVERIGGELHIGRSDKDRGTRITVLFK